MSGIRFDVENQLSLAQGFTGAATVSTNSYAKQTAAQDISIGRRLALLVLPTIAQGAGSTMVVEVIQATDAGLTAGIDVLSSASVLAANMGLGKQLEVPIPQGTMTKKYIGARVTLTGGTTTITADIYLMPQDEIAEKFKSFPKVVQASV